MCNSLASMYKLRMFDRERISCSPPHCQGWLRRNPFLCAYASVMCPRVRPLLGACGNYCVNACHLGVDCDRAHSEEEILYHPENYGR